MPRVFDNIEHGLLPALQQTLEISDRADFCVGYFNLRGWKAIDHYIERWPGGEGHACRLIVGMQRLPQDELRTAFRLNKLDDGLDNQTVLRLKRKLAEEFREQLSIGAPTDADEAGLRRLAHQIRQRKVVVKLYLRHPLHAKLYLLFRPDPVSPTIGYLGSSNLTFAGLANQGGLNVDVLDADACDKLAQWFEDRWQDRWSFDISDELATIIEQSWAREEPVPPYHIYIKMAYHLSQEARAGLNEFQIPREFRNTLFDFQTAAVKIAAHHLNARGGVLIGDVVGLGKTLMATALARIFEDDYPGIETLIICPKNLVSMWEDYRSRYGLRGMVLSLSEVTRRLPDLKRYLLVLIDESHNLRNREGKRYRVIQEYLTKNESRCILLSATPYNKTFLDLSSQLRLFLSEEQDLGVRPERLLREIGETEFVRKHQCPVRSLAAFEKSEYADDWRELMRLFLVRRTRGFILDNYARTDPKTGQRYLTFGDGARSYFPERLPRTVRFGTDDANSDDQYDRLYAPNVVDAINRLKLPRYGLGNYIGERPKRKPSRDEQQQLDALSRSGRRLMGFCRTNLFKRLESSGSSFIQSIERHILRNYVYLHAIEADLPLPIGTQDVGLLDSRVSDEDSDRDLGETDDGRLFDVPLMPRGIQTEDDAHALAAAVYTQYARDYRRSFRWIQPDLFSSTLADDLRSDARSLLEILRTCGDWIADHDAKLAALVDLVQRRHPSEKILIFSQFADTVHYLESELRRQGVAHLAAATGESADPTQLAARFSPVSNGKAGRIAPGGELRVLLATDVLSEGQNLQDCAIVVNYDLPWAIIRLIQRVGRVDRIGQKAPEIFCYSFLPADGVERIIQLRARVRRRLTENAEVVGTDEAFFEDDDESASIVDLYNEKAGILDAEMDNEVDLASYAYQIWKNATEADPKLERIIPSLPPVVFSTRAHQPSPAAPDGVLVYLRTGQGNDALAWVDQQGHSVTESQFEILKAAACSAATPPVERLEGHHDLVETGARLIAKENRRIGGQLGRRSGARSQVYERLQPYAQRLIGSLFEGEARENGLFSAIEEMYRYPLQEGAATALNRQLRSGISDDDLARLVCGLRDDDRLCHIQETQEEAEHEPRIICSLGLSSRGGEERESAT